MVEGLLFLFSLVKCTHGFNFNTLQISFKVKSSEAKRLCHTIVLFEINRERRNGTFRSNKVCLKIVRASILFVRLFVIIVTAQLCGNRGTIASITWWDMILSLHRPGLMQGNDAKRNMLVIWCILCAFKRWLYLSAYYRSRYIDLTSGQTDCFTPTRYCRTFWSICKPPSRLKQHWEGKIIMPVCLAGCTLSRRVG